MASADDVNRWKVNGGEPIAIFPPEIPLHELGEVVTITLPFGEEIRGLVMDAQGSSDYGHWYRLLLDPEQP